MQRRYIRIGFGSRKGFGFERLGNLSPKSSNSWFTGWPTSLVFGLSLVGLGLTKRLPPLLGPRNWLMEGELGDISKNIDSAIKCEATKVSPLGGRDTTKKKQSNEMRRWMNYIQSKRESLVRTVFFFELFFAVVSGDSIFSLWISRISLRNSSILALFQVLTAAVFAEETFPSFYE